MESSVLIILSRLVLPLTAGLVGRFEGGDHMPASDGVTIMMGMISNVSDPAHCTRLRCAWRWQAAAAALCQHFACSSTSFHYALLRALAFLCCFHFPSTFTPSTPCLLLQQRTSRACLCLPFCLLATLYRARGVA